MIGSTLSRWALTASVAAAVIASSSVTSFALPLAGLNRSIPPTRPQPHLVARRETLPPFAFVKFCAQQPDQCARQGDDGIVILTGEKRAFLQRINFEINNEITYTSEDAEEWKVSVREGDCEDFAMTKRQRLLDAGWPSGALRLATARTKLGIGHVVLVVTTHQGDLVLDNRTNIVKPWFATALHWLKIQSPENPRNWLAL